MTAIQWFKLEGISSIDTLDPSAGLNTFTTWTSHACQMLVDCGMYHAASRSVTEHLPFWRLSSGCCLHTTEPAVGSHIEPKGAAKDRNFSCDWTWLRVLQSSNGLRIESRD